METQTEYPIDVDYDCLVEKEVAEGGFNAIDPTILQLLTSSNFSTEHKGKHSIAVIIHELKKDMDTPDVIRELEQEGLRPAEILELLAFGKRYPDIQREFPLVALGSTFQFDPSQDDRAVPVLAGAQDHRAFGCASSAQGWSTTPRFLAVRQLTAEEVEEGLMAYAGYFSGKPLDLGDGNAVVLIPNKKKD